MADAEMRYMDEKLYDFIEKFEEMTDYDNSREAQRELADRLENIPMGMILNQPLKTPQPEKEVETEKREKTGLDFKV